ncbi:CAP domain-containing protein [Virgibacillus byunsanensis]|uniref:CAP domain-containing protein n=1 Tax=Virgibacillus byunsanensis TaxID=570945 RepID=A0ABW3LLN4_9BACI
MKIKTLFVGLVSLLFIILVACADNNEDALDPQINEQDREANISNIFTDLTSEEYPHTQPVKIQDRIEAKYEFRRFGGDNNQQNNTRNQQNDSWWQNQQRENDNQGDEQTQQNQDNENQQPQAQQDQQQQQQQQEPEAQQEQQQDQQQQTDGDMNEFESTVIDLTNGERSRVGLSELQPDTSLGEVAREKSRDMEDKDYFSHTSPTYGSPFDMMRDFGVSYQTAGENIAQGQPTPQEVVDAWMNSQGHRENILNDKFTHIGVGYIKSGHHWTQMFIAK